MSANVLQCPNETNVCIISKHFNCGNVYEDAITMKQTRISNKWKKCSIRLTYPFYITVTDMSVENSRSMPYRAIELVEQCQSDSKMVRKTPLKFKLISKDPKQNMKVQCCDIDQYLDLTSSISCMIDMYKFTNVQNLKSKYRMAKTASVDAEQSMASTSVTDIGGDKVTEGKMVPENGATDISQDHRADQWSVASFETDSSFDDYDDEEPGPEPLSSSDRVSKMTSSPSMLSLQSTSSSTLSYFSCVEEIHNSDIASAESGSDSRGSVFNSDSNLSALPTVSPGDGITDLQPACHSGQCLQAESAQVPLLENISAENVTTERESFGSIQEAVQGVNIVAGHFVDSKQLGAGDFMQSEQQLRSANDNDVRGRSSESNDIEVNLSLNPEQAAKPRRHRGSRIRRILRWFTKCIRANDSDVEH